MLKTIEHSFLKALVVVCSGLVILSGCTYDSDEGKNRPNGNITTQADATARMLDVLNIGEPPNKSFDLEAFKAALDAGADINARSRAQLTPVYLATIAHAYLPDSHVDKPRTLEALRILVERGADVNAQSYGGSTPLMHAVHRAHTGAISHNGGVPNVIPSVQVLLSATNPPIDLEIKNDAGWTALAYYVRNQELESLRLLQAKGANFKSIDNNGETMIMKSVSPVGAEVYRYVLAQIPESDRATWVAKSATNGRTALMSAAAAGATDMVQDLIQTYNVDRNAVDVEDETALSLAEASHEMARLRSDRTAQQRLGAIIARLEQSGAQRPSNNPDQVRCSGHNDYPTTFERLKRIVTDCNVQTSDQLMGLLPRPYLSNYSLIFGSQGAFRANASARFPRIIMMGKTGEQMIAINGNPNVVGAKSIEMVEFKTATKTFEFREIDLSQTGAARFSEANPAQCLTCHRSTTPRPNWYNWTFWPGAYFGEQHAQYDQERTFFREYKNQQASEVAAGSGVYRHLLNHGNGRLNTNMGMSGPQSQKNSKMDDIVGHLTSEMAMEVIRTEPRLANLKYAILGALSCNNSVEEFLTPAQIQARPQSFQTVLDDTNRLNRQEFLERLDILKSFVPGAPNGQYIVDQAAGSYGGGRDHDTTRAAKLRYLIEGAGVPMEWSSIPSRTNYYIFGTVSAFELNLWKKLLQPSGDEANVHRIYKEAYDRLDMSKFNYDFFISPFRGGRNLPDSTELCRNLKQLSLARLAAP